MAAIAMGGTRLDFSDLFQKLEELLPFYARPVFLRIADKLETTSKVFGFTKVHRDRVKKLVGFKKRTFRSLDAH